MSLQKRITELEATAPAYAKRNAEPTDLSRLTVPELKELEALCELAGWDSETRDLSRLTDDQLMRMRALVCIATPVPEGTR